MRCLTNRVAQLALVVVITLASGPTLAQSVAYHGKLQIGFGDSNNATGFRSNNAVPIRAGAGPLVNPATIGTTLRTLWVNALGSATPGVGGALTFHAVGGASGGAQQKNASTCFDRIPDGAHPRLRSRTQVASAHFPGRKGPHTSMITTAPGPATPTATYMLSAGGGNTQVAPTVTWLDGYTGSGDSLANMTFVSVTVIPEQGATLLIGLGLAGLASRRNA